MKERWIGAVVVTMTIACGSDPSGAGGGTGAATAEGTGTGTPTAASSSSASASAGAGGLGQCTDDCTATCLVSNRTQWALAGADCIAGTTLTLLNEAFACDAPLESYCPLPLRVIVQSTEAWSSPGAVLLDSGCTGDGDPDTIDPIAVIEGARPTSAVGPGEDAFKTRTTPGPQNIQVTGSFDCGRRAPDAHQDAVQIEGGSGITFVNVTVGDHQAGLSTVRAQEARSSTPSTIPTASTSWAANSSPATTGCWAASAPITTSSTRSSGRGATTAAIRTATMPPAARARRRPVSR